MLGIYSSLSDQFEHDECFGEIFDKKFCISNLMNCPTYVINMYLACKFSLAQHSVSVCVVSEKS